MTTGTSTANVAAALIPPQHATATADRAAARARPPPRPAAPTCPPPRPAAPTGPPPWAARTRGSKIHGSIAAGRNSDDRPPIRVSAAGAAGWARAAALADPGGPAP